MNDQSSKVESYTFKEFKTDFSVEDTDNYTFHEFSENEKLESPEYKKVLKIEKTQASENNFVISPIVKKYRGINKLEEEEFQRRVEDEVHRRVSLIEEDAFNKGFEEGVNQGKEEVYQQTIAATEEKLEALTEMISEALHMKAEIVENQKMEIYETIRNLTKWVILRELKDDGQYIERLLEKLIVEMQTKSNILIQVNKNHFEGMEEILAHIEQKVGTLSNVRIESDFDINDQGIVIESENGIINGTMEQQFKNLDKLFESVGLDQEEV